MGRPRFTDERILAVVEERRTGVPVAALCRKYGISSATFHVWSQRFADTLVAGIDTSDRLHAAVDRSPPSLHAPTASPRGNGLS